MAKLPILQSGFLSYPNDNLVKPELYEKSVYEMMLGKEHRAGNNINFYFDEVVSLYNQWSGNNSLLSNFGFREKIILAAMRAFGHGSIYSWLNMQNENANLSALHEKFIIDTLNFVGGKARSIQTSQWLRMVEVRHQSSGIKLDVKGYFINDAYGSLARSPSPLTTYLPANLSEFLKLWLSQPKGFEDLLICLYIIFGNRPYVDDVARKPKPETSVLLT